MQKQPSKAGGSALVVRRSSGATGVANRIRGAPTRLLSVGAQSLTTFTLFGAQGVILISLLLVLFVLHALFVWNDQSPEGAFDRSATLLETTEIVWDTSTILLNAITDTFNTFLIPAWNSAVYYAVRSGRTDSPHARVPTLLRRTQVEPSVFLLLEAFSVVFEDHQYQGVLKEADYPYKGLNCMATAEAARFCGRYKYYEDLLIQHESGFANESSVSRTCTQVHTRAPTPPPAAAGLSRHQVGPPPLRAQRGVHRAGLRPRSRGDGADRRACPRRVFPRPPRRHHRKRVGRRH